MQHERARGALLGLAVGDALGTTYEFDQLDQPPYPALAAGPADDIVGGGPFALAPGCVTDDTQMAVCLANSLAARGRLDVEDLAARYVAWSAHAFDIGNQTHAALHQIARGTAPLDAGHAVWRDSGRRAAGNGSLMRTTPLAVAYAERHDLVDAALAESAITHADPRCALACACFDVAVAFAIGIFGDDRDTSRTAARGRELVGAARKALALATSTLRDRWRDDGDRAALEAAAADLASDLDASEAPEPGVLAPLDDPFRALTQLHLYRTPGFVRVAFRLAFWHAVHTPSWHDAVVDVASRGGDSDTNAAIAGALLGARDGASAIPAAWIERVLAAHLPGPLEWADAHHPRHLLALT